MARDVVVTVVKQEGPVREVVGFRLRDAGKYDLEMVMAGLLEESRLPGVTIAVVETEGINDCRHTEELIEAVKMVARDQVVPLV